MYRDEEYFLNELQKDSMLLSIFKCISEFSTIYHKKHQFVEAKEVKLKDVIKTSKSDVINKSENIIQSYIDKLISLGLCRYVVKNGINDNDHMKDFLANNSDDKNDVTRLKFYKDLGYPKEDSEIVLTSHALIGCTGVALYKKIIVDKEIEELDKNFKEEFRLGIEKITKPYDDKIEKLTKELEDKISELNRAVDGGIIKNIQVISVFAGIISLLFANIMGIKEFSSIGVQGLLMVNFSMVIAIFALLLFTKLLIVGGNIERKYVFCCFLIILLILTPIIFH